MPDTSCLLTTDNNYVLINEISYCIYKTITTIQKQKPELLTEKNKNILWDNSRYESIFTIKLKEELNKTQNWNALIIKVKKFLQLLLIPSYFESQLFVKLLARLHQLKQLKPGLTILEDVPKNLERSKEDVLSVTTAINKVSTTEIGTTVLLYRCRKLTL